MSCNCPPPPGPPPCGCDCTVSPPRRTVEKFRDPTPEPIIRQERRRNPTPPGDIVERVIVKRQPQEIIERITEQPRKPPPRVVERVELEGAPPPQVRDSCIYVDPSLKPCPFTGQLPPPHLIGGPLPPITPGPVLLSGPTPAGPCPVHQSAPPAPLPGPSRGFA